MLKSSRKKRILLVITRLTIGGDTNVVLDMADYFNKHPDFEVLLAVGPVPDHEIDSTHLAYERLIPVKIIPSLTNHINPIHNLKALLELRTVIVEGEFDIVHTHSSVAGVIGRLAAISAQVPVIVHHVHGWGLRKGMSFPVRTLYLKLEQLCARISDRLIAVSRPTIQKGLDHKICAVDKFTLIYNGIPLERFRQSIDEKELRLELGLHPDHKIVGMIGRLDQQKNPLDLIRSAAIVCQERSNVQFIIAGEGVLRPQCEALIQELQLQDKFFLLGFRNDVEKIMPVLTLTAMSSLWEGLPVVFQESMSAGKPIVANDVDGASDVIVNGETGFLVEPHKPQEMANSIMQLLNDDPLCHEMGVEARVRSNQFSVQRMLNEIEQLYWDLLVWKGLVQEGYSLGNRVEPM
ncbi:MAG: glycosyltransferase family 4 protein [Candidatus Promineifilaceae bacterium]|nr:glycosyltransferase family 4 protein [Candidatus Promineifilaceae bacterium]